MKENIENKIYNEYVVDKIILSEVTDINRMKFSKISKDEKDKLNNIIATKLLMQINRKFKRKDFIEFEKTKGNFFKFKDYQTIEDSIKFLEKKIITSDNLDYKYCINTLSKTFSELLKNKKLFMNAFNKNNSVLIILYDTVAATLVLELHSLMLKVVKAEKDNFGRFNINIFKRKTVYKNREVYNFLTSFNDICTSQKINGLALKEDLNSIIDNIINTNNLSGEGNKEMAIALGISGGILVFIALLRSARFLVYYIYNKRQDMTNSIDELKEMLQLNIDSLNYRKNNKNSKEYEKIISKQEKWMAKLDKLRHFIEIKDKTADENTSDDINKADKEISEEIYKNKSNDESNNDNNILI